MYWCNCKEGWKAKGHKLSKSVLKNAILAAFQPCSVHKDETCIHCGYTALFSKTDPNNLNLSEAE